METRTKDNKNIFRQEYKYDELGNRAETQWNIEDTDTHRVYYRYDSQYQLTGVEYNDLSRKPYIYRYDDNGNRTYFGHEHGEEYYSYDNFDRLTQRYIGEGRTIYQYDQRGNLINRRKIVDGETKDTTEYEFDIQDRLRNIKHNGQIRAEYEYDHRGLRTKNTQYRLDNRPDPFSFFARWDTSAPLSVRSEQYYWYGAGTEVLADTDDKGNVTGIYIMAGGRKIATVASRASATRASSGAETRYYHTDVLGSVTAITDEQGRILEANIYGPFGETEFSYDRARISLDCICALRICCLWCQRRYFGEHNEI